MNDNKCNNHPEDSLAWEEISCEHIVKVYRAKNCRRVTDQALDELNDMEVTGYCSQDHSYGHKSLRVSKPIHRRLS